MEMDLIGTRRLRGMRMKREIPDYQIKTWLHKDIRAPTVSLLSKVTSPYR
jgi:hypothetical protein